MNDIIETGDRGRRRIDRGTPEARAGARDLNARKLESLEGRRLDDGYAADESLECSPEAGTW